MSTQTITIPAREVRPGDVLFGMTVDRSYQAIEKQSFTTDSGWTRSLPRDRVVTVERPVPSDPIGTVRARVDGTVRDIYLAIGGGSWRVAGRANDYGDADVADLPILWKPGMPIPTEGVQA